MSGVFHKMRNNHQLILDLKGLTPANSEESLPDVSEDLKQSLKERSRKSFEEIKTLDKGDMRKQEICNRIKRERKRKQNTETNRGRKERMKVFMSFFPSS